MVFVQGLTILMQNPLKKLWFWRNYTTTQHTRWWAKRKKDWQAEINTYNHSHRHLICHFLKMISWNTLLEIGMGGGANLALIANVFKGRKLVGTEINKEALAFVRTKFKGLEARECPVTDIFMSDKGVEVAMTDMVLIYVGPRRIMNALRELKRVSTNYVLLCEFHHTNWFKRQWLRIRTGYHSYDYKKLLKKLDFYDIITYPISLQQWPDAKHNKEFRTIIMAKVPRK